VPVVLIDRLIPGIDASAVVSDHRSGVAAAVEDLIAHGHRRIGFISGPPDIRASRERFGGFVDGHDRAGVPYDEALIRHGSYAKPFGEEQTAALLAREPAPTAIVAGGVQLAMGAIAALHRAGVRIGEELSLVSCDESELMAVFSPPISAVRRDSALIGSLAADLLLERLEDGPARTVEIPTDYVRRESVSSPPG
jgi:LacI family transcriptional regulator